VEVVGVDQRRTHLVESGERVAAQRLGSVGCDLDLEVAVVEPEGRDGHLEVEIASDRTEALRGDALARFDEVCSPLIDAYDLDADRGWLRLRKAPAQVD
ncbi:MAG: hypothetical protein EBY52_06360, partial [Actinobacteria bacterium]|nr:hypothetical protein [Actinomycetota bacterium]